MSDGDEAATFSSPGAPVALAPDPHGRLLAAGDLSGSLHLWDFRFEDHTELEGYPDPVELLAWDGAGEFKLVRLYPWVGRRRGDVGRRLLRPTGGPPTPTDCPS